MPGAAPVAAGKTGMLDFNPPYIDKERCLAWAVDEAPCQAACPLGMDVEGYVTAAARGDFRGALQIMRETCALPAVCGRVCHRPCEAQCKRVEVDAPVSIRALKRFIADYAHADEARLAPIARTRQERIAIVGSGPAGLAAAYDLIRRGYGVTVYEALACAGGMLAFGIPEFDLPQEVIQREIDFIRALGVDIKTNTPIGENPSVADLLRQGFAAVLVAVGAQQSARLPIPGAELEGVIYALPFLHDARIGQGLRLEGRVLVVGGGNVAIDAARTAVRLGAQEVSLACIESKKTMPAYPEMIKHAEREGVKICPSLAPQRIASRDGRRAFAVELRIVAHSERATDGTVQWTVVEGTGATCTMEADWIVVAIGQKVTLEPAFHHFETGPRNTFVVDSTRWATNVPAVYAAGDIVAVPNTVTEAMAMGRKAAHAIDRELQGEEAPPAVTEQARTGREILPVGVERVPFQDMPLLPTDESVRGFIEVELGFTREQAMAEARRCLKCRTCLHCLENTRCVAFVPVSCNGKKSPVIAGDLCEACGRCARSCIYRNIHLT